MMALRDWYIKWLSRHMVKKAERNADPQAGISHFRRVELARSVSGLILPPVDELDRECEFVARRIGTDHAVFNVITDDAQIPKAGFGYPDGEMNVAQPLSHSVCLFVVAREQPLLIEDTTQSEVSICLAVPGVRAYAGVPVFFEGYIIGALAVWNTDTFTFQRQHISILQTAAQRIENQITVREVQAHTEQVEGLVLEKKRGSEHYQSRPHDAG